MRTGVPIKVKIGLKPNGHADYPDWTTLPLEAQDGEPHQNHQFVKWYYDKTSGHEDDNGTDSPQGMQWGMMIVSDRFASEAVARWPKRVFIMDEAEAQVFWETRCTAHRPRHRVDGNEIVALEAQRKLMLARGDDITALDAEITKALDGNDPRKGVIKVQEKTWEGAKERFKISIKAEGK